MDAIAQLNIALAGRYEIDREIGAGGMANVFVARDLKHNRRVALKVLKPKLSQCRSPGARMTRTLLMRATAVSAASA